MSLDGKILARAKARLDERRAENERMMGRRRATAYARDPRIAEIDAQMKRTVIDAIDVALKKGADPVEALDEIRDRSLSLQEERALTLTAAGFSPDYLSESYICPKCKDTGYDGTKLCSCLMDLYREEQVKELSQLLKLGEESFDSFRLDYYSDEPDPRTGISPRALMAEVFDFAAEYARNFSMKSLNLFFRGGTGLGKTFLASSIAKVVAERGYSVVYDTAATVFSRYEQDKFNRGEALEKIRSEIKRIETCDLLIIDDLGTEMPSNFVTSALYTIINTRNITGKKTIITSNLTPKELGSRYSPAVMSRLEGDFMSLRFVGKDIRRLKSGADSLT